MGQTTSCFQVVAEHRKLASSTAAKTPNKHNGLSLDNKSRDNAGHQRHVQQQRPAAQAEAEVNAHVQPAESTGNGGPSSAADAGAAADVDPTLACCLGAARQAGGAYDVSISGPPLPGCEEDRLQQSHLGELVDFAPKDELRHILALVCNMFSVKNALVSLFFDRRVYIMDGTGVFSEGDFPWRYSMCGWTMASERHCVMIVNDVLQDGRFCNSPVAKKYGVRFYVGAPLVSSNGHRLGTLCFADSRPRVFDDGSLQLLCNFSELVTRALERDLAVAHHEAMRVPEKALQELEQKHQYGMILRNAECVDSAVLLVDTGTQGWTVRYANSGWQHLVQHHVRMQAMNDWVSATVEAPADAHSGKLPAPDQSASVTSAPCNTAEQGSRNEQLGVPLRFCRTIVGRLLWPKIQDQLMREPDGGAAVVQQLQSLLANKQPFTLHGLDLEGFGDASLSLVFRSAGLSDIEGGVPVCVPTWVPPSADVSAAAEALQAGAADLAAPDTTCAPWQSMYFVTVTVDSPRDRARWGSPPGLAASSCGSFAIKQGSEGHKGILGGPAGSSGIVITVPSRTSHPAADTGVPFDDDTLLVLSGARQHSSCSSVQPDSSTDPLSSSGDNASFLSSCATSITASSAAAAAQAVCRRIEGLRLGGLIASGSYGRVYRGEYYSSTVAVKVLESDCVLRREAATGLCLEALLGEKLKHPNVITTFAWAVVTGKNKLAVGRRLWGETLGDSKPTIAENMAAVAAAQQNQKQQQQQPSQRQASGSSSLSNVGHASYDQLASVSEQLPTLQEGKQVSGASTSLENAETWLVLEYCNKGCLQDAIDRGWLRNTTDGALSLAKVVVTAAEIAAGMHALHRADVVHGDLSPYNVLLTGKPTEAAHASRGFVAKVSDFGLSQPLGGRSKLLTTTYGTITHMSPELLEHGITSKAVDVYSFGVLLWQMLANSRAWAGLSHHAVVHTVCVKKHQLVFPADAPEALVDLGQACLAFDPQDRPSFEEILEVLRPLQQFITNNTAA